jgi:hypothetical protein
MGIPTTTVYCHVLAAAEGHAVQPNGRPPLLSMDDEKCMADWIRYCARVNLPVHLDDIRSAAAKIAQHRGRQFNTKDGLPGRKWWIGFKLRHPGLVSRRHHRLPPGLPSREQLVTWTRGLLSLILEHDITIDRIYNVDETGIDGRYGKGARVVHVAGEDSCVVGPTWRGHFTCVVCVCADGTHIPPMWIAQGSGAISDKEGRTLTEGCIKGTGIVNTPSGWIDNQTWSVWLQFFIQHVAAREKPTRERPIILILDSHESRFAWQSIEFAIQHHIIIYALLPNSTSICQPLDVGFFGPFKVIIIRMLYMLPLSFEFEYRSALQYELPDACSCRCYSRCCCWCLLLTLLVLACT